MTEVPQATAREEAVELMTRAMYAEEPGEPFEVYATAALDALLAPRRVKCATCWDENVQRSLGRVRSVLHDYRTDAKWETCPDCDGFVTVPSLAILRADLEVVGGYDRTNPRYLYDEPAPWEFDLAPLYRIASEEKA